MSSLSASDQSTVCHTGRYKSRIMTMPLMTVEPHVVSQRYKNISARSTCNTFVRFTLSLKVVASCEVIHCLLKVLLNIIIYNNR